MRAWSDVGARSPLKLSFEPEPRLLFAGSKLCCSGRLAASAGDGPDFDRGGSCAAQHFGAFAQGGAGGEHIIEQGEVRRRLPPRCEGKGALHVAKPLFASQAALRERVARADEQARKQGPLEGAGDRAGEPRGLG